jgi:hypothetical protein
MNTNWQSPDDAQLPAQIQSLFREYRESLPDFDASPDFLPSLWRRIDSQQKATYSFWRLASGFVTASVALSMAFAFVLWTPPTANTGKTLNPNSTYVEVLADDSVEEVSDSATI